MSAAVADRFRLKQGGKGGGTVVKAVLTAESQGYARFSSGRGLGVKFSFIS